MTSLRTVSPARLLVAAVVSLVLSVAVIVGLGSLLGAVTSSLPLLTVTGIFGRLLFVAAVVLTVLAVLRKVETRSRQARRS